MALGPAPAVAGSPAQTEQRIDTLTGQVLRLSVADILPADYFLAFLERVLQIFAAPAGSVWSRTDQGNFQEQCQLNPGQLGRELLRGPVHNQLLRQVVQQAKPAYLPNSVPSAPDGASPDMGLLAAPIISDLQVEGIVAICLGPERDPQAVPSMMQFLVRLADLAAVYVVRQRQQAAVSQEQLWAQLEAFAQRVHGSLHPTEVAYRIANEGRQLVGCERLAIATRQRRRSIIEAISGVDMVDQRSNVVRRLRRLCDQVLDWGERLVYQGRSETVLPPDVHRDLDAYLEESHAKVLVVLPLRDPRDNLNRPARAALVLECFETTATAEQLTARLEVLARHATSALYNATAYRQIPLRFLWQPVAKLQAGLGGKTRAIIAGVAAALSLLLLALVLVPYPLKMDAKGQLLPEQRRWIYAPVEGQVARFAEGVEPGSPVVDGQSLVLLYDVQLESKLVQLTHEIAAMQQDVAALAKQYNVAATEADRLRISADKKQREAVRDRKFWELRALRERTNSDGARPGYFWLKAPVGGTILNWDFRETLTNKQVKPSDPLLRIGDKSKRWEVELRIPQKHMGQIVQAFAGDDPQAELDVDVLVISAPTRTFKGKLARAKLAGEANPNKDEAGESEPVVLASVRIDGPGIAEEDRIPPELLITGTEVHTKVRCGDHALGYSLLYGVWEFFYEKVVFFF